MLLHPWGSLLNAADYRSRARQILPRGLFEYIDRGTEDEIALKRLRASLDAITLLPSVLTGHGKRHLDTTLLGRPIAAPLIVAPTALAGLVAEIMDRIRELHRRGIGFLIIEHDLEALSDLVDDMHVLNHGSLLASGSPQVVLTDPRVRDAYLGGSVQ